MDPKECKYCANPARDGFDFCCSYCAKDWEKEHPQRAKYEVCDRCDGFGVHTNPAIDGNGLTSMDIERLGGMDFLEEYLNGDYDVRCEKCGGNRVIDDRQSTRLKEIEDAEAMRELRMEAPHMFV